MKRHNRSISYSILAIFIFLVYFLWLIITSNPSPQINREVIEVQLTNTEHAVPIDIAADKLPEFTYNLDSQKFTTLLQSTADKISEFIESTIIHNAFASESVKPEIHIDHAQKKLHIKPNNKATFTPGKYKLSLTLRTLEGPVHLEQDFTWGVIAVNTDKATYLPGETAQIGFGVLNDNGETQCMTGYDNAKVWMIITAPNGSKTELSTETGTIKDSGECGSVTVTNKADFQTKYRTLEPGIYIMNVTASIRNGVKRTIIDYFTVAESLPFSIQRHDFPTRIYPGSPYPVAFKVKAYQSHTGTLTEVVPKEFEIASISSGGKIHETGAFKILTWNTSFAAQEEKKFSYIIRFPMVSPEFYLLGPIQIAGFKETRQWHIASDAINSTSGLAAWEDNGGPNTYSRVWTGTTWNPALGTTATTLDTSPTDGRWFKEVSSPKTGEKLVAVGDNVNPDDIYMFRWSGTAWSEEFKIDLAVNGWDTTRGFDLAYEEQSGEALFVYSDGADGQLFYRRRTPGPSGSWSAAANAGAELNTNFKRWVRVEPQFESDTILVGYLTDTNNTVGAMIWDGSTNTFTEQLSDAVGTSTAAATDDEQAFDIAWETQSGTPMLFWGTTGNNIVQREFSGGTWQAETSVASGFTNDVDWLLASSDPRTTSNNIALATQEGTACVVRSGVWTGASATMNGTTYTCASVTTNNLVDTAFENNTGEAIWALVRSTANTQISWFSWTSGGGFTASTTEAGTSAVIESISLYGDLNTTSMMLLYHDNATTCDLWHREWDGASWSAKNANALYDNMCAAADDDTVPYGFGFDRNLETVAAYRWFANNNGTSVVSALTTQDTAYTLSQPNQAFRLRLLLYYPDALAINGRQYKLQYVDPGTGTCENPTGGTPSTWTDVPTSGGQISFNNNATPADGDNLTSNGLDPTYLSYTVVNQDYEEANNFTNSVSAMTGDQVGKWDFSLIDNTTYDRVAQSFCFRVARSNDLVLRIGKYPQLNTAAVADVLIQGGSRIQRGTRIQ